MIQFEASYNEITPIDFHFPPPPDAGEELQCSNWSLLPLTQDQATYAALDALCLIHIF
ncbi:putative 3'-5' exonuclease domain, ribonuclease H-like superfamily [Helianthus anomalus]